MNILKQKFNSIAKDRITELNDFVAKNSDVVVDSVTVGHIAKGMRDVLSLITETSLLDPNNGIEFHGLSISDLYDRLPKTKINSNEPTPELLLYLLLITEMPSGEDVDQISDLLHKQQDVPGYVYDAIKSVPKNNPMTQLMVAISSLQTQSKFSQAYLDKVSKSEYWSYTLDDSIDLLANLPQIVSYIYHYNYTDAKVPDSDSSLDWAGNLAYLLGDKDSDNKSLMKEFMRLYCSLHSDHEGANASAFTAHVCGSTLANPYASMTAALCSLSGPLHGMATQTALDWISKLSKEFNDSVPTPDQTESYITNTLAQKQVVPGYGHAVLRITDPRFTAQLNFAQKHNLHSTLLDTVRVTYDVAPKVLGSIGKIKNPFPNVDGCSGALLNYFGFKNSEFYPVLFGLSRALGITSQLIWSRALSTPIFRPKSADLKLLSNVTNKGK